MENWEPTLVGTFARKMTPCQRRRLLYAWGSNVEFENAYVVFSKSLSLNTSSSLILKILNEFEHMMNSKLALHTRTQIQHELEFFLIV